MSILTAVLTRLLRRWPRLVSVLGLPGGGRGDFVRLLLLDSAPLESIRL